MLKAIRLTLLLSLLIAALLAFEAQAATSTVTVLTVKGTINPVLAEYITSGIARAEENNSTCVIIQMDTPGGLDTAMRDIVKSIVNARIPVVVYVSPPGARAASAGVFITVAAHVAVMAPDTNIGAAHPVSIGTEGEATMSSTMEEKVVNDAAAYIRSLAEGRARNIEWAEKAVRESVSATEQEALKLNVIDLVSPSLADLLTQLDGRQVTLLGGQIATLNTQGAAINYVNMTVIENFLNAIADPNIAYILLSLAILGITAEIFNPGAIFPGLIGGICLLLAFYSLGMLPVNYTGVLLIVLAFGLFIAEVFTHSFGVLTIGGLTSLILGSLILFKGGPLFQVSPWLIALVATIILAFVTFVVSRVIRVHRRQPYSGNEELVGKTAVVRAALDPEGMVLFKGERWTAISESGRVEPGEEVVIQKVDGLKLYVTKDKKGGE
ncbi:MAG: nodulation protein NfeD [Chloroflexota bacterium]